MTIVTLIKMGVIVNLFDFSYIISSSLFVIVVIFLSFLLLIKLPSWFRWYKFLSRIPGPKGVPIFGNALDAVGDGECKLS